jgi:hypothetical protein
MGGHLDSQRAMVSFVIGHFNDTVAEDGREGWERNLEGSASLRYDAQHSIKGA